MSMLGIYSGRATGLECYWSRWWTWTWKGLFMFKGPLAGAGGDTGTLKWEFGALAMYKPRRGLI